MIDMKKGQILYLSECRRIRANVNIAFYALDNLRTDTSTLICRMHLAVDSSHTRLDLFNTGI